MRSLLCKTLTGLAILWLTPATAFSQYLCAINEVYRCAAVDGCSRVSPRDANLAGVMVLDVNKKQLILAPLGGTKRADDIDSLTITDDAILLYGMGKRMADRTFNAVISLKTGKLSAGLSTLDSSFALLGECSSGP
jgi:hypothetical protein